MDRLQKRAARGVRLAAAVGVASIAAAVGRLASADSEGEPIRLAYRAALGCPDEAAFVARVRARTARARFVGEEEAGRTFTVELASGAHPSGSVTITHALRTQGARRLDSDTCDEVADALALMVALAVDPHALTSARPVPTPAALPTLDAGGAPDSGLSTALHVEGALDSSAPPPEGGGASLPPPSPAERVSPAPSAPSAPSAPPARKPATTPAAGRDSPSSSALRRHFVGGVDLAVATGVSPQTTVAGAPYLGWRGTGAGLLGPSLRGSFLRAGTGTIGVPGGSADFTWTAGRLDGCGMIRPDRSLRLGACARAELGVLDVSGIASSGGSKVQHSPWVAAGALARLEWSFLGPLLLAVEAGPALRITVDRFIFLPGTTAHQVGAVGFSGEAGLGVHFF